MGGATAVHQYTAAVVDIMVPYIFSLSRSLSLSTSHARALFVSPGVILSVSSLWTDTTFELQLLLATMIIERGERRYSSQHYTYVHIVVCCRHLGHGGVVGKPSVDVVGLGLKNHDHADKMAEGHEESGRDYPILDSHLDPNHCCCCCLSL